MTDNFGTVMLQIFYLLSWLKFEQINDVKYCVYDTISYEEMLSRKIMMK